MIIRFRPIAQIYRHYQKEFANENPENILDRADLPPYSDLKYFILRDYLDDPGYPKVFRENLLKRIRVQFPKLYERLEQDAQKQEQSQALFQ